MRLRAALRGDLVKVMDAERRGGATGGTKGIRRQTRRLKQRLRRETIAQGLSRRLANTWRESVKPEQGVSLSASGVVYSRAPHIVSALAEATTIRARKGRFLAKPTPATPRGPRGARLTPGTWPEQRFGPLRLVVDKKRRRLFLVVDGLVARGGKRGGFRRATVRKATKTRGSVVSLTGLTSVVMFELVPQVRSKKVYDLDGALRWALDGLPAAVVEAWPTLPVR